jgi:hypothetical protein
MKPEDKAVVQQALEAFEHLHSTGDTQVFDMCYAPELIPALRQLLEQPEPVQEGRDWSLLEATQESLREHMAEIKRLKDELEVWQRQVLEQGEVIAKLKEQHAPAHGPYSVPIKHLWPVAQPAPDMYWDDDDSERPASDSIPELLFERWNNGDLAVGYEVSMTCAKQMEPLTVRVTKIDEDTYDIEYEVVKKGGA